MSGDILTSAQESAKYHQQILQQFPWQKASICGWYTSKCSLTCLGPWAAIFPWIFLLLGKALSHHFHPLVTLLQLPDTLLPLPYSILKGKQLPELLQAKISWLHLHNSVVQAKPVPLGFSSSKTCSTPSFHKGLTTSAGGVMLHL